MNYKLKLAVFALTLSIFNCKSATIEKNITETNALVMALHNETMARHGEIMGLVEELKNKTSDTGNASGILVDSIRTELDGLNEEMMDWMAEYEEPDTKDEAALNYLKEQADILNKLKSAQIQNIEAAKRILQK
jgi:hypothetical protein